MLDSITMRTWNVNHWFHMGEVPPAACTLDWCDWEPQLGGVGVRAGRAMGQVGEERSTLIGMVTVRGGDLVDSKPPSALGMQIHHSLEWYRKAERLAAETSWLPHSGLGGGA